VSALARAFGLSRSTLLHYHRIGLLEPTARTAAGYRLYSQDDARTLARLLELRAAGLSLDAIRSTLHSPPGVHDALRQQVAQLDANQQALHNQRQVLMRLLQEAASSADPGLMDRQTWTAMFRAIGLSDADMRRWHAEFERSRPQAHRVFLASLGIPAADIARIRRWARA